MKAPKLIFLLPLFMLAAPAVAQEKKTEPPAALVDLQAVRSEMISKKIWVPGSVVSRTDSNIASEVAGRIIWMAEVGYLAEGGEVLAKLDLSLIHI